MGAARSGADEVAALVVAVADAERRAGGSSELADLLCRAFVACTAVDGAALVLSYSPTMAVPVGASDADALQAERVQFALGQGPCYASLRLGRPVLMADLTASDPQDPEGLYSRALVATTPWRVVASTPFELAPDVRAALLVYCRQPLDPRDLPSEQVRDAAVALVVGALRRSIRGGPAPWLDAEPALARGQVWVAEEAVALAGGSDLDVALSRLRAAAFASGATLEEVAADVVEGRLAVADLLG